MVNKLKKITMITFERKLWFIHSYSHKEIFPNIFCLKTCRSIFVSIVHRLPIVSDSVGHHLQRNPEVLLRPWPQDGPMTVKPLVPAEFLLGKSWRQTRHRTRHMQTWLSDTSSIPDLNFKPKLEESSKAHVGNGHANQKVCSIILLLFPDAKSCAENGSYLWSCVG